ncbi:hypothetical protein THAOC_13000 [Thalassiosira oceanica]|uniref:MYND-type domain-containing protein n=1 Tax=Thalassiosira oceanica TaxID=159749 RepID=K0SYN2_THAOC|nr:hypothetical protein THAOC_13000 [Thalassiosira oceanica]|eukprot:EJK66096.1 hypothetical protein THAOC_13000 [Thalassiosira oceanica]
MPSRKKAQGRRNRAKKEATRTAELRSLWEPMALCSRSNLVAVPCEHTLTVPPEIPQEGPAVSLMNYIAAEGFFQETLLVNHPHDFILKALQRFPEVGEESERSLAIDLLLRFLRNVFVSVSRIEGEKWFHQIHGNEVSICCMIYLLELLGTYSDMSVVNRRAIKISNKLIGGNRRDVVKFVAKRLPCTCLKELHCSVRKKVEKVGRCIHCLKQVPRSQLRVCTGCMNAEYCSRACQRADWSRHKNQCGNPELLSPDLPQDYVLK